MPGECRDAKAKFQMSDSLPHTRQEIENGRKSVVLSSSISLRRYFALEEHEPSQIYPHASGEGPFQEEKVNGNARESVHRDSLHTLPAHLARF